MSARPRSLWLAPAVVATAAPAGFLLARLAWPITGNRYFPWIMGRGLGLSCYASLSALCLLGLWLRHPWRLRWPLVHPETALRLHAALGAACIVLLAGHLAFLASDRYAGVGWRGLLVPGAATYRPAAVSVGLVAAWVLLLVACSARLGARLVGWRWLWLHQLALPCLAAAFVHGVLAGSDTAALRAAYAFSGGLVLALFLTRRLARVPPHPAVATVEP